MSLLEVRDLNVQFHNGGEKEAVRGLSFHVEAGEIVGIVGESGCGKSTAMRAVMGLLGREAVISCGHFSFEGRKESLPLFRVPEGMAMMFQDPSAYLNPTRKIGGQLIEAVRAREKISRAEAKKRAADLLEMTGIRKPQKRMRQYSFALSGGMQQRVVAAMALAVNPSLIIADEPTTALDVIVQGQIITLLKKMAEETKAAILLVSHDLGVVASLCQRIYVMKDGSVVEAGSAEEIFYAPKEEYTRALVRDARLEGMTAKKPSERKPECPAKDDLPGGSKQDSSPDGPAQNISPEESAQRRCGGEEVLKLKHVTKIYRDERAGALRFGQKDVLRLGQTAPSFQREGVRDISLTIQRGTTFGLIGESGSGKSTLAELITGQKKPDSGEIWYQGRRVDTLGRRERRRILQEIQMVFQDPYASLNPKLTAAEALLEAMRAQTKEARTAKRGEITETEAHKTNIHLETKAKQRERAVRLLEDVGIEAKDADKYPRAFSGGQRQRITIARALISNPQILVCDEAVSALDVSIRAQILELLSSVQRKRNVACLFISHDLNVVKQISQQVGVLYMGNLIETGKTKEICGDPWHPYTKQLLDANPVPDPKRARRKKYAPIRERSQTSAGCPYYGQCGYRMERCGRENPPRYRFGDREVACFLYAQEHRKGSTNLPMTSQI